jgi:UDP-N-acetylmuramyl pentapeptide synthase
VLSLMWGAVKRRLKTENPYVIGVTGSVGKTSTKEALATVLEATGKPVVKTVGNMATDTGIPLSLLGFTEQVKGMGVWTKVIFRSLFQNFPKPTDRPYWVLECSSDKPGDLAFIGKHVPPDVAVFTSGGPVHLEYYKTQEGVLRELEEFLKYLKPEGYVVINGDDQFLQEITWPPTTLKYGVAALTKHEKPVELRGKVILLAGKGMETEFAPDKQHKDSMIKEGKSVLQASVAVVGKQQLAPLVAAALVARKEGMTDAQIKKGIEAYNVPAGRGRIISGIKGTTIVDDSANASPEAAVAGVAMLKPWAKGRRTVAVLGTMNELGEAALEAHREVAAAAAKAVDFLVAVGKYSTEMTSAAKEEGMPTHKMLAFATPEQLFSQLEQVVERNDIIYVKASQNGMRLERLVKRLMANPEEAEKLLVRQSTSWQE